MYQELLVVIILFLMFLNFQDSWAAILFKHLCKTKTYTKTKLMHKFTGAYPPKLVPIFYLCVKTRVHIFIP